MPHIAILQPTVTLPVRVIVSLGTFSRDAIASRLACICGEIQLYAALPKGPIF